MVLCLFLAPASEFVLRYADLHGFKRNSYRWHQSTRVLGDRTSQRDGGSEVRVCLGCSQATAVKSHSSQAQSSREQVETEEIEVKLNRDARCQ